MSTKSAPISFYNGCYWYTFLVFFPCFFFVVVVVVFWTSAKFDMRLTLYNLDLSEKNGWLRPWKLSDLSS